MSSIKLSPLITAPALRFRGWLRRNRPVLSVGLLAALGAVVLLAIPHSQYCEPPTESGQQYCSAPNVLSATVFFLIDMLSDFGAAITGLATVFIAAFTYTLWRSTNRLWEATNTLAIETSNAAAEQAELTRSAIRLSEREFIATNRPHLIVRHIYFNDPGGDGGPVFPSVIYFTIVNNGTSPATITSIETQHLIWARGRPLPPLILFAGHHQLGADARVIRAGGFWDTEHPIDEKQRRDVLALPNILGNSDFHLFARLTYEDRNGIVRQFGFCRRFNINSRRFDETGDTDHEYAD